jgi:predicted RNase H-like nuclease
MIMSLERVAKYNYQTGSRHKQKLVALLHTSIKVRDLIVALLMDLLKQQILCIKKLIQIQFQKFCL